MSTSNLSNHDLGQKRYVRITGLAYTERKIFLYHITVFFLPIFGLFLYVAKPGDYSVLKPFKACRAISIKPVHRTHKTFISFSARPVKMGWDAPLTLLTLIVLGGGELFGPCDAKFNETCPCSHNNCTVLIKLISMFDTALVMPKI